MAKTVNLGVQYTHRLTLRLTDDQMDYLITISNVLGVTPSEYIRMTINATMVSYNNSQMKEFMEGKVGTANENVETDKHDIV